MSDLPSPSQNQPSCAKDVREILARTKPEDYDGHTEFARMSALERLRWLDQAVLFVSAQKRMHPSLSVAEDSAKYKAK